MRMESEGEWNSRSKRQLLESLYGGQFTLSTPLIKPNFCIFIRALQIRFGLHEWSYSIPRIMISHARQLWLAGKVWFRGKINLKIHRSVKTPLRAPRHGPLLGVIYRYWVSKLDFTRSNILPFPVCRFTKTWLRNLPISTFLTRGHSSNDNKIRETTTNDEVDGNENSRKQLV